MCIHSKNFSSNGNVEGSGVTSWSVTRACHQDGISGRLLIGQLRLLPCSDRSHEGSLGSPPDDEFLLIKISAETTNSFNFYALKIKWWMMVGDAT